MALAGSRDVYLNNSLGDFQCKGENTPAARLQLPCNLHPETCIRSPKLRLSVVGARNEGRAASGGMNHSDAVVPDAREAGTNGLPYIPFSHTGMPAGYALLGGKPIEQSGESELTTFATVVDQNIWHCKSALLSSKSEVGKMSETTNFSNPTQELSL